MTTEPRIPCTPAFHEALKHSAEAWRHLELVGTQPAFDPDDPELELELRNCRFCKTTLAIETRQQGKERHDQAP